MRQSDIPPDFFLSELDLPFVASGAVALEDWSANFAGTLSAMGRLTIEQAITVSVDVLIRRACIEAMSVALAQGRVPDKARWQEVTSDTFDRVLAELSQTFKTQDDQDGDVS